MTEINHSEFKVSTRHLDHDFCLHEHAPTLPVMAQPPVQFNGMGSWLDQELMASRAHAAALYRQFMDCHKTAVRLMGKKHPFRYLLQHQCLPKGFQLLWVKKIVYGQPGLSGYEVVLNPIGKTEQKTFKEAFPWEKSLYLYFEDKIAVARSHHEHLISVQTGYKKLQQLLTKPLR
ncbi:hypothetical protein ACWIJ6_22880 [Aeromonas piscicola]